MHNSVTSLVLVAITHTTNLIKLNARKTRRFNISVCQLRSSVVSLTYFTRDIGIDYIPRRRGVAPRPSFRELVINNTSSAAEKGLVYEIKSGQRMSRDRRARVYMQHDASNY